MSQRKGHNIICDRCGEPVYLCTARQCYADVDHYAETLCEPCCEELLDEEGEG